MPAANRKGDMSAGADDPPTAAQSGSPDVIINGKDAMRVGDPYVPHGGGPHSRSVSSGSSVVIVNGQKAARIGDDLDCGDVIAEGSPDVVIGDQGYPLFVAVEPGVFIVSGSKVYDNSDAGQTAVNRDTTYVPQAVPGTPTPADAPQPEVKTDDPTFQSCDQFPKTITTQDMSIKVSRNFILGTCKNVPCDQRGLTANQIACNWAALCYTILDPIRDQFKFSFNSGFRTVASGMGNTDHGLGCAADISCGTTEQTIAMFKWIVKSGLPFSQIIYEKHNSAWVHISYRGKQQSAATRVMWTFTGSAPYGHGGQNGENLPAVLRP